VIVRHRSGLGLLGTHVEEELLLPLLLGYSPMEAVLSHFISSDP
jgi:hypothetical protein